MKQRQKKAATQQRQKPPASNAAKRRGSASQLRIIGGQWRSRRLPVASVPGLRPTPDRVRETLFNWLQFEVPGVRCLDLFAGSGALGFEALSREAAQVVMVEKHPAAFAQLQANVVTLQAQRAELINRDALLYLQTKPEPFEVIFLDPPFRKGFVDQVLNLVMQNGWLTTDGLIYLEHEMGLAPDLTQWNLRPRRETKAGQVVSVLLERAG